MALLWPLFARSALANLATVVAGATIEGVAVASVRRVGLGSPSHCVGGHESIGRCSGLSKLGRRGLGQTLIAGTTGEGADLASERSVGVGSASQCGGGIDR
jgi:hypothetical protein